MRLDNLTQIHFCSSIVLAISILPLAGCELASTALSGPVTIASGAGQQITGTVHGGQQPVVGAILQLYAAGTTGYGTGATALIPDASTVQTDATGDFTITGDYTCPAGNTSQLYIVATGGNSGGGANNSLALMTALGSCQAGATLLTTANPISTITINEQTTVAAVTALQQFMSVTYGTAGAFSIGAPSTLYNGVATAQQGMANAFATAAMLVNPQTGISASTATTYVEADHIASIANILASCVNSADTTNGMGADTGPSSNCTTLFNDMTVAGSANIATAPCNTGTAPSDTVQAMYAIATHPVCNVTTLFDLAASNEVFSTPLASLNDFSLAIGYAPYISGSTTSYALASPYGLAVDAYGNVWLANELSTSSGVVELGPTGTLLTGPITSFTASGGDDGGNTSLASSTRTISTPHLVAIDQSNNAWVPNEGDSQTQTGYTTIGSILVAPGSTSPNIGSMTGVAATTNSNATGYYSLTKGYGLTVDANNNVYVASSNPTTATAIGEFSNASSTFTSGGKAGPSPFVLATDISSTPNLYVVGQTACSDIGDIVELSTSAIATQTEMISSDSNAACTGVTDQIAASTSYPTGIAVDENDNLWITDQGVLNGTTGGITYLVQNRSGSAPSSGTGIFGTTSASSASLLTSTGSLPDYGMVGSLTVAVDGNNNAWVCNDNTNALTGVSVSTASGSPVITPFTGSTGLVHIERTSASPFLGSGILDSRQVAIDASGNVWLANNNSQGSDYVTVVVGVAAPAVTPLAQALKSGMIGEKP